MQEQRRTDKQKEATVTVVGLGSGHPDQLTLGVWKIIQQKKKLYVRTRTHDVVAWLEDEGIEIIAFDDAYDRFTDFPAVYRYIVDQLLATARQDGEVLYGVPGHPMVAEATVQLLREASKQGNIDLRILGGESFLDQAFTKLGIDPVNGFQFVDGAELDASRLDFRLHTIVTQVYDSLTASEVKLSLMDRLPDDTSVVVAHRLGLEGELIERVPLYELDRLKHNGNWTMVWIPALSEQPDENRSFDRLHEIVQHLRSPEGCPWDREQTHRSIRKNLIEETYELLEAIDEDDVDGMCEELGDILMQVMLHAQMEEEQGTFDVYDVIEQLVEKLIRRHPHVFGNVDAGNAEEALMSWQAIKDEEKKAKGIDVERLSVLSGVPIDLPALLKAYKLQSKAAKVGFDWDRLEDVLAKVEEEWNEFRQAIDKRPQDQEEELGDVLFSIVNVARFMNIDPELALASTNRKFIKRFSYIEENVRLRGDKLDDTPLIELERLWQKAKEEI